MKTGGYLVRPAEFRDAEAIFNLVKSYPEELLPRALGDIVQNIDRFLVCERKGRLVGTVSWQILPEIGKPHRPSVEIKSLAVMENHRRRGVGQALVQGAVERIRATHATQVIALTFSPRFFERLGFRRMSKRRLMHKIYAGCANCTKYRSPFTCPEVAVALPFKARAASRRVSSAG
jgi:amino-acid N-acetyltransferase